MYLEKNTQIISLFLLAPAGLEDTRDTLCIVRARRDTPERKDGVNQGLDAGPCKPPGQHQAVPHVREVGHAHIGGVRVEKLS